MNQHLFILIQTWFMRNSKTIELAKGLSCTALELSVADVIGFLIALNDDDLTEDVVEKSIIDNQDDFLARARKLIIFNKSDFDGLIKKHAQKIMDLFVYVNFSYFDNDSTTNSGTTARTKKCKVIAKELQQAADILIREGHTNVFGYGWGFFIHSLHSQEKLVRDNSK